MAFNLLEHIQKIKTPKALKGIAGKFLFKKEPKEKEVMKSSVSRWKMPTLSDLIKKKKPEQRYEIPTIGEQGLGLDVPMEKIKGTTDILSFAKTEGAMKFPVTETGKKYITERAKDPVPLTASELIKKTVVGVPVFAGKITQEIARNIGSAGVTVAKPFGGKENVSYKDFPIAQSFAKDLFTEKPIESMEDRMARIELEIPKWVKGIEKTRGEGALTNALKNNPELFAFLGVMGSVGLDITPFGMGGKGAFKAIVKAKTAKEVSEALLKMGVKSDVAKKFATKGVKVIDEKSAKSFLIEIAEAQKVGKVVMPKIEPLAKPISKELEPLAEQAKKYKNVDEFVKRQNVVYHGSPIPLKKFSNKKGGVFFTDDYADATGFAGSPDNVYEGFLRFKKPLVIDAKGAKWDKLNTKYGESTQEVISNAQGSGYDGVIFKNVVDNVGDTANFGGQSTIYYAYKPQTSFITKSQLTDIYNQSTKAVKPTPLKEALKAKPKVVKPTKAPIAKLPKKPTEILEVKKFKTEEVAEQATKAKAKIREIAKKEIKGFDLPEETKFRYLQKQLQDKMNRLKLAQKEVVRKGGKIDDATDAYLKQELYYGKAGHVIDSFDKDFVMPFLKGAKDKKITIDDLGDYLYAKHAPERNIRIAKINPKIPTGGSGMTDEMAETILKKFDKQGKIADLEALTKEFYENVTSKRLKLLKDSGLEKVELVKGLETGYTNYVPLKGKEGMSRLATIGQGFSITGKDVRRAFGRGTKAKNPFVQSILDYQSTLIRAEKNKVSKSFLKLVEENPNPKLWEVEGLKYAPKYDKTGEMISLDPRFKFADNVLQVRVDGKIKLITIHDRQLAEAMKNIGVERGFRSMVAINNYLRGINTIFNPEFLITNFQRDLQTALINVGGEQSLKMAKNTAKNIPKAMKGIYRNIRKGDVTSEWGKIYQELQEQGGKTGFFDMQTIDEKMLQLQKKINIYNSDKTTAKMSGAIRSIGDYISDVNEVVEMAVRTSAYKEALVNGFTKERAASLAKNLTVNFNKKGNWGTMLNTFYLFANAGIQGSARVITALRYKNVRKLVYGIMAGSFALNEMNRIINEEEYNKLSDHDKNSNWIFMTPSGHPIRIKLFYGFNIFKILGDIANDAVHQEIGLPDAGKRILVALDDAYNPLSSATVAQFISPTITDPLVQMGENKNWFGSPIKPSQPTFGAPKKGSAMYWGSVRPQSKAITDWLDEVTGGSEVEAGFVSISPEHIDHIIDFTTGGVGKFISNSLATTISLSKGEFPKLNNIPFVRKVVSEPSEYWEKTTIREIRDKSATKELSNTDIKNIKTAIRDGLKDGKIDEDYGIKIMREIIRNQAKIVAGRVWTKIKNASSEEKKKAISELNDLEREEFIKILKKNIKE